MSVTVRTTAGGVEVVVADELRHPRFNWPLSRIAVPVGLPAGWDPAGGLVASRDDRPVPAQLGRVRRAPDGSADATVYLLTDLPAGASRAVRLAPAPVMSAPVPGEISPGTVGVEQRADAMAAPRVAQRGDAITVDNGLVRVEIAGSDSAAAGGALLRFGDASRWLGEATLAGAGTPQRVEIRPGGRGPVFCEYTVDLRFAGDRRYWLTVRVTAGMEFVELDERIEGFAAADDAALVFDWYAVGWTHRYCANRPESPDTPLAGYGEAAWEPVDRALGPAGAMPMVLVPYHNWLTWWRLPAAAFWSEPLGVSVGVFITDHERWDDGEWAIWSSSTTLAGRFFFDAGRLRWHFPLATGTRSLAVAAYPHERDVRAVDGSGFPLAHIDTLHRWHAWLPLDKVKDWTLDHVEPGSTYPRFFDTAHHALPDAGGAPTEPPPTGSRAPARPTQPERPAPPTDKDLVARVDLLRDLIARDAPTLNTIPDGTPRSNHGPTPVGSREVHELLIPLFDEVAGALGEGERRDLGAALQFLAHVFADETLMPTRRMLAGHPNFLADVLATVVALPFLFPTHPQARRMVDHIERATALNLKYHTRPDVPLWWAQGGRWTENLGCYVWRPVELTVLIGHLLRRFFDGHNRAARPETSALGWWLLNTLSAPMRAAGGRRTLPPQGAHAHGGEPYRGLRALGQELVNYDPLLAEYLLWAVPPSPHDGEPRRPGSYDAGSHLQAGGWQDNGGTDPQLESAKFTGYGFVLRAAVGTPDEVSVHLQQIDAGPNYRWGRAARGGNGVVYYYAAGQRYSSNNVEDVGDLARGDVERCTNFGVRKPGGYRDLGAYRGVGPNELTEPLHDLGFAQFARVIAAGSATPEYTARNALLCGAEYLVLFDEVRDGVPGRLSWFVDDGAPFPSIAQLVPGARPTLVPPDPEPEGRGDAQHEWRPTKGRYYDGTGSFLTVVSHLDAVRAEATPHGCRVRVGDREDLVFLTARARPFDDGHGVVFDGTVGIVRRLAEDHHEAALFAGTRLGVPGVTVTTDGRVAVGVRTGRSGAAGGTISAPTAATVVLAGPPSGEGRVFYLDGQPLAGERTGDGLRLRIPAGRHRWEWLDGPPTPGRPTVVRTENRAGGCAVVWTPVAGAVSYRVQCSTDGGTTWQDVSTVDEPRYVLSGLTDGVKVHVRVVAVGEHTDGSPSRPYPVYVTADPPPHPDGLLLARAAGGGIVAVWGEVLGAHQYRLYRRRAGESEYTCVAAGLGRRYVDVEAASGTAAAAAGAGKIVEYRVSAVNGNGESPPSPARDTDPAGVIDADPRPDEVFRRSTQSYENGYEEVNPWIEERQPILSYPRPQRRHWTAWRQ
ncbi:hypothetical protein GCM10023322_70750 [Rugosimonospora acidiphila]|uniref:Fibronectin type-III domain-containing protein n=1 Tax=Rugosimonospora acidiphila TaxID=556531 RepID=A0ABP9SMH1_9ACTN